ncbi:metallophosphoesterase [bacterium]|nr:metallophosphoesterase [bacterium]
MSDSKKSMEDLLNKAIEVLETESNENRPYDDEGKPGGLVLLKQDIPTLIVPDIHGRSDYLPDLMHYRYKQERVYDHLKQGALQIVCVGDGMHSERRGLARWRLALEEYKKGFAECPAMAEEMKENFQTMAMVMRLKASFPKLFHFLKGNHENIMDEEVNGNHPFAKLAAEGPMTRSYVERFYGTEFLAQFNRFEKNLPLVARGRFFVISHSRPKDYYDIEKIINYRIHPDLIEGLTWTRHNSAKVGIIPQMLEKMLGNGGDQQLWFAGHTAIRDLYNLWDEEHLVEIHNPDLRLIVALDPNERFDPDFHIHILPRSKSDT